MRIPILGICANFFLSFASVAIVLPAAGFAETFLIPPGTSRDIATVNDTDDVRVVFEEGRCYCCDLIERNAGSIAQFTTVRDNSGNAIPSAISRGRANPAVGSQETDNQSGPARKCFVGEFVQGGSTIPFIRLGLNVGGANPSAQNITIRCYETTLVGGFNTSVTDFNFLELTNTLRVTTGDDGTLEVNVVARNAINDTEVLNTSVTVNPGDRVDVNIHDAAGPGAFGPVNICHNGPAGALKAELNQYRIVTTSPLDFEPVAQSVFTPAGRD